MYDLTVIIPTFNEEANIRNIVMAVDAVFHEHSLHGQILVVDDNSPDGTIAIVHELMRTKENVSILVRERDHGLSQSVADGFSHAGSEVFFVIDADFSHPPVLIPRMYEEIRNGNDIVIGSRYMEGGGIRKWPLKRRAISLGATFLGRLLFPDITDPVSGFFAVKKTVVEKAPLKPRGYKILLEVLGKGTWQTAREIPFEFVDRETGASKLKLKTLSDYVLQIADIAVFSLFNPASAAREEWEKIIRFGLVGISGIIVNEGILIYLKEYAGFSIPAASIVAIELSILSNFLFNDLWTFRSDKEHLLSGRWQRFTSFQFISIGGAIINFAILNILAFLLGIDYRIANIIGILVAFAWNFFVNRNLTWKKTRSKTA
jgi:dolichol-phosphate mannosyltransferase